MAAFLQYLKSKLKLAIPHAQIIWYDSIVRTGELAWQDKLCSLNKLFFDACDGIFTNYTWKSHFPMQSTELALERNWDVYTGIDVWGRNTFGGGGFNCHRALRIIEKAKTSVAIFAPAWTLESFGQIGFHERERRFWKDRDMNLAECANDVDLINYYGLVFS
jgi:mannosyl-glycoprotein endo-beta-N-acetylglucosaminidase